MKNRSILAAFGVLLLLGFAASCSDDETTDTDTDTDTTADTGTTTADTGGGGSDTTAASDWVAALYRVTEIAITEPTGVGAILEGLIQPEIDDGNVHILIQTQNFSSGSGDTAFEIRGGTGEETSGSYGLLDEANIPWATATVSTDGTFTSTESLTISFPIALDATPLCDGSVCAEGRCRTDADCEVDNGFTCDTDPMSEGQCVSNIIVPLRELTISGSFAEDAGTAIIQNTQLNGAILKEDADNINIQVSDNLPARSMTDILQERRMDYPDEVNPTGWRLSAIVAGPEVTLAQ